MGWSVPLPPLEINPFFLALSQWSPAAVTWNHAITFLGVSSAISVLLIAWVILRLRRVCTARNPAATVVPVRPCAAGKFDRIMRSPLPGTSPSLDRSPLLWRECRRGRPSALGDSSSRSLASFWHRPSTIAAASMPATTGVAEWVNGLQISVGLLVLSVIGGDSARRGAHCAAVWTSSCPRRFPPGSWYWASGWERFVAWRCRRSCPGSSSGCGLRTADLSRCRQWRS